MKSKGKENKKFEWTYRPPKVDNGKQTFDQMSLVQGIYEDYFVLKTGKLTGAIAVSGVNLDLLSSQEQGDLFDDYNAFLISTFGEEHESLEFRETTVPVNMEEYIKHLKKIYLKLQEETPEQVFKINLVASYIDHFSKIQRKSEMTTKERMIIASEPIKSKRFEDLQASSQRLKEKLNQIMKDLSNSLSDYDVQMRIVTGNEYKHNLKNLINFEKNDY